MTKNFSEIHLHENFSIEYEGAKIVFQKTDLIRAEFRFTLSGENNFSRCLEPYQQVVFLFRQIGEKCTPFGLEDLPNFGKSNFAALPYLV